MQTLCDKLVPWGWGLVDQYTTQSGTCDQPGGCDRRRVWTARKHRSAAVRGCQQRDAQLGVSSIRNRKVASPQDDGLLSGRQLSSRGGGKREPRQADVRPTKRVGLHSTEDPLARATPGVCRAHLVSSEFGNRAKVSAVSRKRSGAGHNGRQLWHLRLVWRGKPRAEVIPEGDSELGAGLVEAEKPIAAIATRIAPGAAAHFSFGDLAADIVLRSIGVQWNLGPIEHH